jgi:DNA (cytosine-5)-methyltransferase 1
VSLNVLSLFSGIGGFELGLERAGMQTVGQVEIDPWCRRVLARHWPEVPRHDDVRTAGAWWRSRSRPRVDVLAGGFPCQDISDAHTNGVRAGIAGARSGLWEAYRDVAAVLGPRWVIVENVAAWRRWMPGVRSSLHALGYASVPVQLPAGSFGAPHKRPRVLVVAHADGDGEPLRAIHAQVAGLCPVPRGGGHWRGTAPGSLRVADGVSAGMVRLHALGNAVVPPVAEYVGRLILAQHGTRPEP